MPIWTLYSTNGDEEKHLMDSVAVENSLFMDVDDLRPARKTDKASVYDPHHPRLNYFVCRCCLLTTLPLIWFSSLLAPFAFERQGEVFCDKNIVNCFGITRFRNKKRYMTFLNHIAVELHSKM